MNSFNENKLLSKYINDCKKYKIMNQNEITQIYTEIKKNPELSKEKFKKVAEGNLRWVIYIAKKHYEYKKPLYLSLLDLIGEGNKGLMLAIQKYDISLNLTFSNYAHWWIRQKINRALVLHKNIVKVPYYILEKKNSEYALSSTIINCSSMSFNDEVSQRYIEAEYTEYETYQNAKKIHAKLDVENILKILDKKEEMLIKKRYGIPIKNENYYIPFTQKEIGEKVGKTTARIQQIEQSIIKKIKKYIKVNKLEEVFNT